MKMKTIFLFVLIGILFGCKQKTSKNSENSDSSKQEISRPVYPKTGTYYAKPDSDKSLLFASPIIYDVIVKNPDPADDWTTYCLKNTDLKALMNAIFNAVYQGKLIPYYYRNDDSILSIDAVRNLEKQNNPANIGKLQFNEYWYFDETNLKFYKKINSLTFGYELKNAAGQVYGYKPGFKVYFDKKHNNLTAK